MADTTVNGCTESVVQFEKVVNPQVQDVEAGVNRDERSDDMIAFSADVKRAHKLCRLRTSEHGLMLASASYITIWYVISAEPGAPIGGPGQEERCTVYSTCYSGTHTKVGSMWTTGSGVC